MPARRPGDRRTKERRNFPNFHEAILELSGCQIPLYQRNKSVTIKQITMATPNQITSNTRIEPRRTNPDERRIGIENQRIGNRRKYQLGTPTAPLGPSSESDPKILAKILKDSHRVIAPKDLEKLDITNRPDVYFVELKTGDSVHIFVDSNGTISASKGWKKIVGINSKNTLQTYLFDLRAKGQITNIRFVGMRENSRRQIKRRKTDN